MKIQNSIALLVTSLFLAISSAADAGVVVIVNPSIAAASISKAEAADVFLGKTKSLSDGTAMVPLDQAEGEAVRDEFYQKAANKSASQLKAYWSRQVFTGQGEPPKAVADDDEVKALVAKNPNIIGYVSSEAVDSTVKAVLTLE